VGGDISLEVDPALATIVVMSGWPKRLR
jgi:hypothetical protein